MPRKQRFLFQLYVVKVFLSQIIYPYSGRKCCLPNIFDTFHLLLTTKNVEPCHAHVMSKGLQTFSVYSCNMLFAQKKSTLELPPGRLRNVTYITIACPLRSYVVTDGYIPWCLHCCLELLTGGTPSLVSTANGALYGLLPVSMCIKAWPASPPLRIVSRNCTSCWIRVKLAARTPQLRRNSDRGKRNFDRASTRDLHFIAGYMSHRSWSQSPVPRHLLYLSWVCCCLQPLKTCTLRLVLTHGIQTFNYDTLHWATSVHVHVWLMNAYSSVFFSQTEI